MQIEELSESNPPEGYRLGKEGEKIEEGDMYWMTDQRGWNYSGDQGLFLGPNGRRGNQSLQYAKKISPTIKDKPATEVGDHW